MKGKTNNSPYFMPLSLALYHKASFDNDENSRHARESGYPESRILSKNTGFPPSWE